MTTTIHYDPYAKAQAMAEHIKKNRHYLLEWPIERVLLDAPQISREDLLKGLLDFHRQRMATIPSPQQYPESVPWVPLILTYEKELKKQANLTDTEVALMMSRGDYLRFRAFKNGAKNPSGSIEKCRVAYLPDTDHGALHIKNIDDPPTGYKPDKSIPTSMPMTDNKLVWDGTGSGLHIDDEPDEIFPLDVTLMLNTLHIDDVPSAVQFLFRYSKFWSSANCVLHDSQKRSVAIEKCTRNHMQVHYPGSDGRSWCSGMVCRDKQSDIARYQAAKRQEYLSIFNLPDDGPDGCFWASADLLENRLASLIKNQPTPASMQAIIDLFLQPISQGGLNQEGSVSHPDQKNVPYTLMTHAFLLDEKVLMRWDRDIDMCQPQKPERFEF